MLRKHYLVETLLSHLCVMYLHAFGYLNVKLRIILKMYISKCGVRVCAVFIGFRIGSNGRPFEHGNGCSCTNNRGIFNSINDNQLLSKGSPTSSYSVFIY
jgi:hypothetical protein